MRRLLFISVGLLLASCSSSGNGGGDAGCRDDNSYTFPIGARDDTFYVGPYLMHTTLNEVSISWETEQASGTRLEYGRDSNYGRQIVGDSGSMHQVTVTGLEPQTLYHYRACSDETCSGDLTFSTAPQAGSRFRFAVYGDSRSNPPEHQRVAEGIIGETPILAFNVGDVVENGNNRDEYKSMHFDPTRRLGEYVPIYVAIGNHEMKQYEVPDFLDYMMFPEDPDVPLPELSYTFTYGDAYFLVLDSTLDHFDLFFPLEGSEDPPLWKWLKEKAASKEAQAARWRFALMHYPPDSECYAEADYGIPSTAIRNYVVPLLAENHFTALFAGHQHDYEYMEISGLPCIITGGGGAGLETCANCTRDVSEITTVACLHNYLTVDLGCDKAVVRAVDTDGNVFEQHEFDR
ncbi:MAG TPA: metallophosphoesterase [Myxococcota bacterium]|nr:metallophosphoesterase [Myxococcota bacterium]